MQQVTEFWAWLQAVNWPVWVVAMAWWGWVLFGTGLVLSFLMLARRDFARGCGNLVLLVSLALVALVVSVFLGISFPLIGTIFFPTLAGLLIGGGIGALFAEKGSRSRCPDCGGRIVTETFTDATTKRRGERIVCKSCGRKWKEAYHRE
ncbi:MAG: hypothetical protein HC884_15370 [Chloroflexaceae bacterium]|nr:hypothetical protein [Chloroflexaceae bacterium]